MFLDIRAHGGFYALLARQTGWFERIVAFEPDPANYAQLQANLFLNRDGRDRGAEACRQRLRGDVRLKVDSRNRGGTMPVKADRDTVICQAVRVGKLLDFAGKLLRRDEEELCTQLLTRRP